MKYLFVYTLIMLLRQTRVMGEGSCEERNIIGAVGGAVTLHVPHTVVRTFYWSFGEKQGSIVTTRPGEPAEVIEDQYDGRLSSSSDGSLIISKLRQQDQGTYRAQFRTDRTQFCYYHLTVFTNLTDANITITANLIANKTCAANLTCSVNGSNVTTTWRSLNDTDDEWMQNVVFVPPSHINFTYICTARNPVSVASKVVHPWQYCMGEPQNRIHVRADYTTWNAIRLAISGCVLLITCCVLAHHMKTEVMSPPSAMRRHQRHFQI